MISIAEAIRAYIDNVSPLPSEKLDLGNALRRVLVEDQYSSIDLPRFDQSAMDGYALRSDDVLETPCRLAIADVSAAGHAPASGIAPMTAWRIFTGAPIPSGADTVIPQERVELDSERLLFSAPYPAGKNIRYQGEEIKTGALLAHKGQRLTPGLIASLANTGKLDVDVTRPPRIAVLITGDEVRSPQSLREQPLGASEIADSNGRYVDVWLKAVGLKARSIQHIADTEQGVSEAIAKCAESADLIITTGGASVGDRDYIPKSARNNGFEQIFWKVAQKPGKPLFFSRRADSTLLLGLPGNPGAVVVGMELHARCIINLLEAQSSPTPDWRQARLTANTQADFRRDRLVRMQLSQSDTGQLSLSPLPRQDSHMLSNLSEATVLAHLPSRDSDYVQDEVISYLPLTA